VSAIELRGVAKRFGAVPVVRDIDLVIPNHSTTAVLGASGSGKTTLLRLIAGFEQVDAGTVAIGGRVVDDGRSSIRPQHRRVGYVPQEGCLFPHLNVARNIGFGVARSDRARVGELLDLVGLTGLAARYPHELSGGQQQRVALARALAIHPSVILLDEPFSSLDESLRADLRRDVALVLAETGTTTVLVTHDQDEALELADQIAVLRDGRVTAYADPRTLYRDPPDLAAAASVGDANILGAQLEGDTARCVLGQVTVQPDAARPAACDGWLLLRPEQLVLHLRAGNGAREVTVVALQYHGHDAMAHVRLNGPGSETLLARVPGNLQLAPGQPAWVEIRGPGRAWANA
jgi:iron(III) transport system ATP-binding protein